MKCKLGLSVIAFLTLSLNAQNLSDCFGDTVCNDNFHIDGDSVVLDKHTYTTNGSVKLTNASLNLLNGATLVVKSPDGIHVGSRDFMIYGGNLQAQVLEGGGDINIINSNVTLKTTGHHSNINGNLHFIGGSLNLELSGNGAFLILGWDKDSIANGYTIFENTSINGILGDKPEYFLTFNNGNFIFKNTKISNVSFDRLSPANTPNADILIKDSKLIKVGFGTVQTKSLLKNVTFDNIVLDNSELSSISSNVKVANLTIKNIDGVNSYINANIEVTNSTHAKDDAILKDPAIAGNLTIQNSVIDKRANIKANKYTLIDSDFTGDIKSGTKLSMINSKLKGDISLSTGAVSFDNSTVIGSIVADKLSSKNSTIKGQLITNTLNATNTTFYIYGGGVNTSFYDSYSGAIIVKDKAIGSGNIIHLANTDLSKLTGNLVPIALVDTKDVAITSTQTVNASKATGGGISKNFFEVAYITPLAKYSLNPQYLHFKNFNGIGIWEIGKGSVSNVVDAVDALNIMDGRISTAVTTSPINTSKDISIMGDMFLAPVYNTVALDNIQDIINMPKYLARTKLDIPYNRYKAFKTNNKDNGIWMNNKNGYSKYKNSSIHYTDINLGIDKVINFSSGSSLMLGLAANLSTSNTKGNYVSDSTSKGIGLYTMSKFDSGAFVGLEGFYHNINTDYEVSSLDIKTNKTHDILQGAFILGQKLGSSVYIEPSLKYDVISYKVEDINTDELKIKGDRQTTHTLTANVEVGVNVADKLSSYIGVGYAKELNDKQDLRIKDTVADHIIKGEKGDDSIKANVGLNYNISSKATLNADFGYNKYSKQGKEYKTNVGFAYRF